MNQIQLLQEFESLPSNAQQEIVDFVAFIKQRYEQQIVKKHDNNEKSTVVTKVDLSQFSFAKSRELSKHVKGSLSDVLIEERRNAL